MALPLRDEVPTRHFPWVTVALIAVNVVVFLFIQPSGFQNPPKQHDPSYQAYQRNADRARFEYTWGAIPCEIASGKARSQAPHGCDSSTNSLMPAHKSVLLSLLTSLFVHESIEHIGGNMLFLWVFGNNVEDRLGKLGFLAFYLIGGIVASLGFAATQVHSGVPVVGASGAIAVAMGAYLVFHPRGRVLTAVFAGTVQLVYLPSAVVLVLFFITQFFTPGHHVAWQAHAVGMGFGFLAAIVLSRLPAVQRRAAHHETEVGLRPWEAF